MLHQGANCSDLKFNVHLTHLCIWHIWISMLIPKSLPFSLSLPLSLSLALLSGLCGNVAVSVEHCSSDIITARIVNEFEAERVMDLFFLSWDGIFKQNSDLSQNVYYLRNNVPSHCHYHKINPFGVLQDHSDCTLSL